MIITLQTCPKKKSKGNSPSTGQLDSKDKFKLKNLCIKRYRTQILYISIQPNTHFSPIPGTSDATHYWEGQRANSWILLKTSLQVTPSPVQCLYIQNVGFPGTLVLLNLEKPLWLIPLEATYEMLNKASSQRENWTYPLILTINGLRKSSL